MKAVEVNPWQLCYVPDYIKTQECAIRQWGISFFLCSMFLIGLLNKNKQKYDTMTMNMMTIKMIDLLSGTMIIEDVGLKKHK